MPTKGLRNPPMRRVDRVTAVVITLMFLTAIAVMLTHLAPLPAPPAKMWARTTHGCALVTMTATARPCQE